MPARRRRPQIESLESRRAGSVCRLLYHCHGTARERVLEKLRERGYTGVGIAQSTVLRNMDLAGTPLAVVTQRARVSRQAVAKVAAELESLGYVELVADPTDRRAKIVRPTRIGLQLVSDTIDIYAEVEQEFADIIGERRLQQLRQALRSLYESGCHVG